MGKKMANHDGRLLVKRLESQQMVLRIVNGRWLVMVSDGNHWFMMGCFRAFASKHSGASMPMGAGL